jgi:DUF971 family protein
MHLTKLKRTSPSHLTFDWSDGHQGLTSLATLRDRCPCAGCQGETVLLRHYEPPAPDTTAQGRYELVAVEPVGNYALKFRWGDGHDQGIYTWDHLRGMCECPECLRTRNEQKTG